ncbi:MAG: PH domain-containing protein [Phycisphaeraceae bacterium]|nr:PH domain-containing protein [Phycisphaeraceae bacterium]
MNSDPTSDPRSITRPDPALLNYYLVVSLFTLVAFPIVFLVAYIRFKTLRYRFDEDGIWMAWGLLFRKEITLTYRRIQDIHVTRNVVHRWLGLSTIDVQTAAGGTGPQMHIEGVREADGLRDFLYERMRGAKGHLEATPREAEPPLATDESLALLRELRGSIDRLADRLDALGGRGGVRS